MPTSRPKFSDPHILLPIPLKLDHDHKINIIEKEFSYAVMCSGLVHWEDPEESAGEGSGRGDREGEYM